MKDKILGKLSIEVIKKEDDKYSVALTSELNDTQIGVITEVLYRAHKGEFEEKSRNLTEKTIDDLSKILYVYDRKVKGEWIPYKELQVNPLTLEVPLTSEGEQVKSEKILKI
jgi:hypothetical protein